MFARTGIGTAALAGVGGAAMAWTVARVRLRSMQREADGLRRQLVDPVTGLPIRSVWESEASARLKRAPERTSLLVIDINDFKDVNDRWGHPAGDAVLREVANRLAAAFARAAPLIARLGGDEFGMLVDDVALPGDLDALAQAMAEPVWLGERPVPVGASAGVIHCSRLRPPTLAEALLAGDTYLYAAKQSRSSKAFIDDTHVKWCSEMSSVAS